MWRSRTTAISTIRGFICQICRSTGRTTRSEPPRASPPALLPCHQDVISVVWSQFPNSRHNKIIEIIQLRCKWKNHEALLCKAFHPFLRPIFSMMLAGMQYTGSRSVNAGYPNNDKPIETMVMRVGLKLDYGTYRLSRILYGRHQAHRLVGRRYLQTRCLVQREWMPPVYSRLSMWACPG